VRYKLGKLPARPGAVTLRLVDYLDFTKLAPPPSSFGHEKLVPDWGMFLNDRIGDCACAGTVHEHMLWDAEAKKTLPVNTTFTGKNTAAELYSEVTGYQPGPELQDPEAEPNPTDQGTDVAQLCSFRRNTGLLDAAGNRHKLGAYVALDRGDFKQLQYAIYYFDGVGIGVDFCQEWMDAFNAGEPWDKVDNPNVEGGHYITAVAFDGHAQIVTWGDFFSPGITQAGYEQFNDETYAYLSTDKLFNGKDLEGFNLSQLQADIQALRMVR
jgi:hypothetical protein